MLTTGAGDVEIGDFMLVSTMTDTLWDLATSCNLHDCRGWMGVIRLSLSLSLSLQSYYMRFNNRA